MVQTILKIVIQAVIITVIAAGLAALVNAVRPDGIPLVAEVEYDIFAACRDSEEKSTSVKQEELVNQAAEAILYVDARSAEVFTQEHVEGAVNAPYSVLFGASDDHIQALKKTVELQKPHKIVVYGQMEDPAAPGQTVDLAESLAKQLIEIGLKNVNHFKGGLPKLKKNQVKTVQGGKGASGDNNE